MKDCCRDALTEAAAAADRVGGTAWAAFAWWLRNLARAAVESPDQPERKP